MKYPSMNRMGEIDMRKCLGERLTWTVKEDGSNIGIWIENGEIRIRSRNMENAQEQFVSKVQNLDCYNSIVGMLHEELEIYNNNFMIFGELMSKGMSPTRIKMYEEDGFKVFDMYDLQNERWVVYNNIYQKCFHWDIPIVELYGDTIFTDVGSLREFRDEALVWCRENRIEGVVIKDYKNGRFYKEKIDMPIPMKVVREDGKIELPILPDSEIYGAIDKAKVDLSNEDFLNVRIAMPLIASYVKMECDKHCCRNPSNIFGYYKNVIEGMM